MAFLGEISALITSVSFAVTATFFTFAGRKVGSSVVNRTRLLIGLALLLVTHAVLIGTFFPRDAENYRWIWLGLSGIIGLAMGDASLFRAFMLIGPRLSMLLMSLALVLAALIAWIFMGETLSPGQLGGMLLTISGISLVIREQNGKKKESPAPSENPGLPVNRVYLLGILYGLGGASGQALGLILSKVGLQGDYNAISGNIIRTLAAVSAVWLVTILSGKARQSIQPVRRQPSSLLLIFGGTVFGPLIGVSFSLLAVQHTEIGVASTLIALTPVFMLPIGYFIFGERFGWSAVAGTLMAILGVAVLFLGL